MNRVESVADRIAIGNVLISVSDKRELGSLVSGLLELEAPVIFSTGGTYDRITEHISEIDDDSESLLSRLRKVSDYTGQPEMQGGLVKTLDYKIYLGLLSEPFNENHARDRLRVGAELIDMVVVNLYPFSSVSRRLDADLEDARGNIDIGGPCMLRAAAKSFLRVAVVSDPADYGPVVEEMKANDGTLGLRTRFRLAQKAFAHTAHYDTAIADYISDVKIDRMLDTYDVRNSDNHSEGPD